MIKPCLWCALLFFAWDVTGAEKKFDFGASATGQTPPGFRSALTGAGEPGEWKTLLDEVPSLLVPVNPGISNTARQPVVAQLSQDPTDERFPLLVFDEETYADFTLTTQFKTVRGSAEQMAGIVFRVQDETNYYVLRASSLGNTFRFYKVVNGQRGQMVGVDVSIPSGVWHELSVECKGSQFRCFLNGKQMIPDITDNSFAAGKIGFWTKSDSVSYFAKTRIEYAPRESTAQVIVRETLARYPKLQDLKVYARGGSPGSTRVIAAKDPSQVGQAGGKPEADVISTARSYYGKGKKSVAVTLPLRDRNGEAVAAARIVMDTFPGQTEKNAVERAAPIVREMQRRIQSSDDFVL